MVVGWGVNSFFAWCWWPAVGRGVFGAGSGLVGVGLVDVLQGSVASIGGILAFAGGLGTGPSFDGV